MTQRLLEWLCGALVWLTVVPGYLGWSWLHILWIAPAAALLYWAQPSARQKVRQTPGTLTIALAVTALGAVAISLLIFATGRLAASLF